ncbi:GAF and ANTAR domain-containing protein [Sanguibacter antarcticus]|uniref:GAF domain-containing protein n=1 Tax=Sanguibacter antarcticus TaxID=372484 RepID=A0A2A9E3F1_9MICO|nr:GAF and ANTAR domain-containing protein [Sanguibacter antarcticus]PFG33176.1 GAF domain-containing protein [Sanguibacter antarcticus]
MSTIDLSEIDEPGTPGLGGDEVVRRVGVVARSLAEESGLQPMLDRTVEHAVQLLEGCHSAGISLVVARGRIETVALTDDLARRGDERQYELDEGPCLTAVRDAEIVWAPDLANDARWPRWAPWAVENLGVRSMLCIQLYTAVDKHGALNLYSRDRDAFPLVDHPVATMFATVAAMSLKSARTTEELQSALHTRNIIGQAQGIIMERYSVGAEQAFSVLSRVSQETNMKLSVVATQVAAQRVIPGLA